MFRVRNWTGEEINSGTREQKKNKNENATRFYIET